MLTGAADTIRQPDQAAAALDTLNQETIQAQLDALPDADKRRMIEGIVAVLAGAGLALTLTPKAAQADLSMGEVEDAVEAALRNVLGPLIRTLQQAFGSQIGFAMPPSVLQMLAALLEWLTATPETVITEDPTQPIERSWPADPPVPDDEKRATMMFMAEASRARVIQSSGMFGAATLAQGTLTTEEVAIVTTAIPDASVLTKLNAMIALQASLCTRIGHLCTVNAAHGQLTAHDSIRHANEIGTNQIILERFLESLSGGVPTVGLPPTTSLE